MEKFVIIFNLILFIISVIIVSIAFKKDLELWIKIRWYIHELIAMASNKTSYFSLKRFFSITAGFIFFAGWSKVLHLMIMNDYE